MSKDKIEVTMNIYDIPIVVEELEKANAEIERLKRRLEEYQEYVEINHKEIKRLNNIIKTKDEGIKAFIEDLCEESTKIEKANKYAYDIRNDDFIKYCNIELDILKGEDKE